MISKIIKNIGWLLFDRLIRLSVGLLISIWLVRYLDPSQFGALSYASAITDIFATLAGLGLQSIVVRDIVQNYQTKEEALGTAAILQITSGIISYILLIIVLTMTLSNDGLVKSLLLVLGLTFLFKFSEISSFWFESQVTSKYTVWIQNFSFLLFSTIKYIAISNNASVLTFASITVIESIFISGLALLILNSHGIKLKKLRFAVLKAKKLLYFSIPLLLTNILTIIQARIDQIMLGYILNDAEVAKYSIPLRLVEIAVIGSTIIYSTFAPSIIESKSESLIIFRKKIEQFYKLNILIGFLIALPVSIYSQELIDILFGSTYSSSASILSVMSIRIFIAYLGVARGVYLLNENLMGYAAITVAIGICINICLNYFLIPSYGGLGATYASLISFTTSIVLDLFYKKTQLNAKIMIISIFTFPSLLRAKNVNLLFK